MLAKDELGAVFVPEPSGGKHIVIVDVSPWHHTENLRFLSKLLAESPDVIVTFEDFGATTDNVLIPSPYIEAFPKVSSMPAVNMPWYRQFGGKRWKSPRF